MTQAPAHPTFITNYNRTVPVFTLNRGVTNLEKTIHFSIKTVKIFKYAYLYATFLNVSECQALYFKILCVNIISL